MGISSWQELPQQDKPDRRQAMGLTPAEAIDLDDLVAPRLTDVNGSIQSSTPRPGR